MPFQRCFQWVSHKDEASAHHYRHYYSWVLAMLLGQQGTMIHTVPLVAFKITNFTSYGYSCMADKVPVDRRLTFPVASNLYKDSEELLRNLHLAPYLKPMVSLIDDFPIHQRHKGWQFGYLVNDTAKQVGLHLDTGIICAECAPESGACKPFNVLRLAQ